MENPDVEKQKNPQFEWDSLGKLPMDMKLDGLLIRNGTIGKNQFLDQRLIPVLRQLSDYQEVQEGRVKSIILTRVENERNGTADVFVTKLELTDGGKELLLVPEDRFQERQTTVGYSPIEVFESLSESKNGIYFVIDDR